MLRRRRKGPLATVAVSVMALFALSGMAAGSAQAASWHVEGKAFSELAPFQFNLASKVTVKVPTLAAAITCTARHGGAEIYSSTKLTFLFYLQECKATSISGGEAIEGCVYQDDPSTLSDNPWVFGKGTGESAQTEAGGKIRWKKGMGCVLPLENTLTFPTSTSFSYGEENVALKVTATGGTGAKYGAQAATVSGTFYWQLGKILTVEPWSEELTNQPWGWY